MMRPIFTLAAIIATVLCMTVCVCWGLSYARNDEIRAGYWHYEQHGRYVGYYDAWQLEAFNLRGQLVGGVQRRACIAGPGRFEAFPGQKGKQFALKPIEPALVADLRHELDQGRGMMGFRYATTRWVRLVAVPFWAAFLLFAWVPVLWGVCRRRRRANLAAGLCVHCGYDLRASARRCPECGTPINAESVQ